MAISKHKQGFLDQGSTTGYFQLIKTFTSKGDRTKIVIALMLAFISGILAPIYILYLDVTMELFSGEEEDNILIMQLSILMLIISIILLTISAISYYMLEKASQRFQVAVRTMCMTSILNQSVIKFPSELNYQDLESKFKAMDQLSLTLLGKFVFLISSTFWAVVFCIVLSPLYTLFLVLFYPIFFLFLLLVFRSTESSMREVQREYSQSQGHAEQALNAIKVVSAFGQERVEINSYNRFLEKVQKKAEQVSLKQALTSTFLNLSLVLYTLYASIVAVIMVNFFNKDQEDKAFTAGDFIGVYYGVLITCIGIYLFMPNSRIYKQGLDVGSELVSIMYQRRSRHWNCKEIEQIQKGNIEFVDVSFSVGDNLILRNFSVKFQRKRMTAIIGKPGSGKTTILKLIDLVYKATDGQIIVDGKNLRTQDKQVYKSSIGYVPTEPNLFSTTIKQNLLFAYPDASDFEIVDALIQADIYNSMRTYLPKGIDTVLDLESHKIPLIILQKLSLARAIIKQPKILLLDDPTRRLNRAQEEEFLLVIDQYRVNNPNVNVIITSTRVSPVKEASEIHVVENGELIVSGTHEELLKPNKSAYYSRLHSFEDRLDLIKEDERDEFEESKEMSVEDIRPLLPQKTELKNFEDVAQETTREQKELGSLEVYQKLYKGNAWYLFFGVMWSLFTGVQYPLIALVFGNLLFSILYHERSEDEFKVLIFMAFIILYVFFTQMFQKYSFRKGDWAKTFQLRPQIYNSIISKHIPWFDNKEHSPTHLQSILNNDTVQIRAITSDSLSFLAEAVSALFIGTIIVAVLSWELAIVGLLFGTLHILTIVYQQGFQQRQEQRLRKANRQAIALGNQAIKNHAMLESMQAYQDFMLQFRQVQQSSFDNVHREVVASSVLYGITTCLRLVVQAVVLYFSALVMWKTTDYKAMQLYECFLIIMMSLLVIANLQSFENDRKVGFQSAKRIFSVIDTQTKVNPLDPAQLPTNPYVTNYKEERLAGSILFRNVWFSYPSKPDKWILKDFNLEIKENQMIAIVGDKGCGKTTLLELLLRFHDINYGHISINGIDIKELPLGYLRRQVGYCPSEACIFNYTLYENVLYGRSQASNGEVQEACDRAQVSEFVREYRAQIVESSLEESNEYLLEKFTLHKQDVIRNIGLRRFRILREEIEKLNEQQVYRNGKFECVKEVIDYREQAKKEMRLDDNFYEDCGLNGLRLTQSQKQRIALARALIRKPSILILDDCLSQVSPHHLSLIFKSLSQSNQTTFLTSSNQSLLEKCERIIVIQNGRLIEDGTYKELHANKHSLFKELMSGKHMP